MNLNPFRRKKRRPPRGRAPKGVFVPRETEPELTKAEVYERLSHERAMAVAAASMDRRLHPERHPGNPAQADSTYSIFEWGNDFNPHDW